MKGPPKTSDNDKGSIGSDNNHSISSSSSQMLTAVLSIGALMLCSALNVVSALLSGSALTLDALMLAALMYGLQTPKKTLSNARLLNDNMVYSIAKSISTSNAEFFGAKTMSESA